MRCATGLAVGMSLCSSAGFAQTLASSPVDAAGLVQKIQHALDQKSSPDAAVNPHVPHGVMLHVSINNSPLYPGTENSIQVYVPAQFDPGKPACLLVKLDGLSASDATVLDNLIAAKAIPVMIGVGISPGSIFKDSPGPADRSAVRFDRSFEFDSTNDRFANFVLNEVLPAVQHLTTPDGRPVRVSTHGNDHAAAGASTGGIGSFTLAWQRPDQFTRVYSVIGTFVSMRGGNDYPEQIRKTEPKPIRIFLEDGSTDAWNPLFGSWFDANLNMESSLRFAGYNVAHAWGTHGHDSRPGQVAFPDVMRWLWRDYPKPIEPGESQNSTLREITIPGERWQQVSLAGDSAAALAANAKGELFVGDQINNAIHRLADDARTPWGPKLAISDMAFGPEGTLYAAVPTERAIVAIAPDGSTRTFAKDIAAHHLIVTHDGTLIAAEAGAHVDEPSTLWSFTADGKKTSLDRGLSAASGVALSPDGAILYAAEQSTQWVYSYVLRPDGTLIDKQPFDWLHTTDVPNNSGAQSMAVDTHGNLYVATRMGVQVCDQNGRVRAILPLPTPCGPAESICFGGAAFDRLYVSDGHHVFQRRMKVPGFAPFTALIKVTSQGAG